jgi:hypothetical protein
MKSIERNEQLYFWTNLPRKEHFEEGSILENIHSDGYSNLTLNLETRKAADGDIWIQMKDDPNGDDWKYLASIRLRSGFGGGMNPFITEGFYSILLNYGQFAPNIPPEQSKSKDRLNSNSAITIKRGSKYQPRLSIIGIEDDEGEPRFIDIFVLQSGDVKLQVRDFTLAEINENNEPMAWQMLFQTKENGGQNPFIAEALTKLAEKIAKAKKS